MSLRERGVEQWRVKKQKPVTQLQMLNQTTTISRRGTKNSNIWGVKVENEQ